MAEGEKKSIRDTFSEGSSRLFGSVLSKKEGFVNGLSNFKQSIDSVGNSVSNSVNSVLGGLTNESEQAEQPKSNQPLKKKPPVPRRPSQEVLEKIHEAKKGPKSYTRQQSIEQVQSQLRYHENLAQSMESQISHDRERHERLNRYADEDSGDSDATEGCDDGDDAERRITSSDSVRSWSDGDDQYMDETSLEAKNYMKNFVDRIFNSSESLTQEDKAAFGNLCQESSGRIWFSRFVNEQRVDRMKVSEQIFYRLVQYFAIALFECNESEDYRPAKTLMNMCFTFYYEAQQPTGQVYKHYLYSYMKEQPIWRSLRFWNAAFFDAVQQERSRKPISRNESSTDDKEYQENVVFGQLGTFTCNMRAFGLGKELCLEFLRKQSSTANLKEEQIQMLKENCEQRSQSK